MQFKRILETHVLQTCLWRASDTNLPECTALDTISQFTHMFLSISQGHMDKQPFLSEKG